MEVNMSLHHDVPHLFVTYWAHHQDLLLQYVAFDHLLEIDSLGPIAGDYESDVGICGNYARYRCNKQVGAFVVVQSRDDHYCYHIVRREGLSGARRRSVLRVV